MTETAHDGCCQAMGVGRGEATTETMLMTTDGGTTTFTAGDQGSDWMGRDSALVTVTLVCLPGGGGHMAAQRPWVTDGGAWEVGSNN
jgi:hypothetical protein